MRSLGRPRSRWEDKIKMDLKVIMAAVEHDFASSEKNGWKLTLAFLKMNGKVQLAKELLPFK
jgi:hypothetical protein